MESKIDKIKVACDACGGKGGFKIADAKWYETNWVNCPICDGYCFVEVERESEIKHREPSEISAYVSVRSKLTSILDSVANIISYQSEPEEKFIEITFVPSPNMKYVKITSELLVYSSKTNKLDVDLNQQFYANQLGDIKYYMTLRITYSNIRDVSHLVNRIDKKNKTLMYDTDFYRAGGGEIT